ncbi:unnamed protein product, partial [Musa acuminata subsp. malaccensis]
SRSGTPRRSAVRACSATASSTKPEPSNARSPTPPPPRPRHRIRSRTLHRRLLPRRRVPRRNDRSIQTRTGGRRSRVGRTTLARSRNQQQRPRPRPGRRAPSQRPRSTPTRHLYHRHGQIPIGSPIREGFGPGPGRLHLRQIARPSRSQ